MIALAVFKSIIFDNNLDRDHFLFYDSVENLLPFSLHAEHYIFISSYSISIFIVFN